MRTQFYSNPRLVTSLWGLSREQAQSVAGIDREGLQLAAASFARKKAMLT
jgi:hypothetical protein